MFPIVDVQGFTIYDNRFVLKEIAVVLSEEEFHCFHIKAPFEFKDLYKDDQSQSNWLKLNHHNLSWDYGSDSFKNIQRYLKPLLKNKKVYVKGTEKQKWIEEFLKQRVFNIEDIPKCDEINLSMLYNMYPRTCQCQYHFNNNNNNNTRKQRQIRCALKSALLLNEYMLHNNLYDK